MNKILLNLNHQYIWENQCLKCLRCHPDTQYDYSCSFDQNGQTYYERITPRRYWQFEIKYLKNKKCDGFKEKR